MKEVANQSFSWFIKHRSNFVINNFSSQFSDLLPVNRGGRARKSTFPCRSRLPYSRGLGSRICGSSKMYESLLSTAGKEHPRSVSQSVGIHQSHIQVILSYISPIILSLFPFILLSVFMLESQFVDANHTCRSSIPRSWSCISAPHQ